MRRDVAKNCHILKMLRAQKRGHISFHTPGHKRAGADITELSYSDNLSCPQGVLARASEDIAKILGANKSFILTDGSTSGVLSMLYAVKRAGATKVAFPPSSHKSVFNGCKLLGLTPVVLSGRFLGEIPLPPTVEDLADVEFDALLVTSPTYYGNIAEYKALREVCTERGAWLLVDGAHGGHLHFDKEKYAGAYADMWVDGVHKSLPALTQGAVVSARTIELSEYLAEAVDIFRTTSPSYPVMASVEYAVKYPKNIDLEEAVRAFKSVTPCAYPSEDYTKLCLWIKDAEGLQHALEKRGIFAEFYEKNCVCFYLSPATKLREFAYLTRCLKRLGVLGERGEKSVRLVPAPLVFEAKDTEWVDLAQSVGRKSAQNVGLFPPCTPLVFAGETIAQEAVDCLLRADNVFGLMDEKIKVCKE